MRGPHEAGHTRPLLVSQGQVVEDGGRAAAISLAQARIYDRNERAATTVHESDRSSSEGM
ncbi:hypothetical protein GCM10027290_04170 [Micromonospora sonneratiae]